MNVEKIEQFIKERNEFSSKTFGTPAERDCIGPLRHLQEEVQELIDNPDDTMEWADCFLLLLDAAWRKGHSVDDLFNFARQKLEINKTRTWEKKPNGVFNHVEEDEDEDEDYGLENCESCGEAAWDGYICHNCGMKHI